jgi:hypothetical protein
MMQDFELARAEQQQARHYALFAGTLALSLVGLIAMAMSSLHWWRVQSHLTSDPMMAATFTAIMVIAPPVLTAFVIPWSPGGMLLQKINAQTWGFWVIVACAVFLVLYSYDTQVRWWQQQPAVAEAGVAWQQALVGVVGYIIIPALLWTPVTSGELVERIQQDRLVRNLKLQLDGEEAILRARLLQIQQYTLHQGAQMLAEQQPDVRVVLQELVAGIDANMAELGGSVHRMSGVMLPYKNIGDNDSTRAYLDYVAEALAGRRNLLDQ